MAKKADKPETVEVRIPRPTDQQLDDAARITRAAVADAIADANRLPEPLRSLILRGEAG